MPAKVDTYLALARETAQVLAGSAGAWTAFLDTASRLYKYPFHDQLMIHAQRPGATACASYEVWNDTMRRYVRRGAKGIALVDNSGDAPRLRYVFDIADTGTRRSSRPFSPWQIDTGNIEAVSSALEDSFGAERGVSLASQLEAAAALLVDEYWMGNSRDILDIVDGSSLEEYDDFNIAFIHDANTDEKKKALFSRVRSGNVRVLLGSTAKMGAGTNVQDRLVALHDLDAPWRPGDLEQRKGRIARQGNMNETVHVYRYVTEQTFDSYIWQTLENKQRFISQIMTSKSPVRSCEDADETTLSYAEVKALCAGDPRIREKMDLDVQVAKLRLLKSSHQSQKYQLEDRLLQYYPREIAATKAAIMGCEADIKTRDAHPAPADGLAGIELQGQHYDERVAAGEALLNILPTVQDTQPVHVGSFRGFDVEVSLEAFGKHVLTLKGALEHHVELGADARGNVTRIENALTALDKKLGALNTRLSDLERQVENAREELEKPFPQEDELREKSARLVELNAELDMENTAEPQEAEKPSVLAKLKEPIPLYEPKQHQAKEACR